jgi:hypothetical protein
MSDRLLEPYLSKVYRLEATLAEPLGFGDIAPGHRRIVPLTGGTFTGPEINGNCSRAPALTGRSSCPMARSATSATRCEPRGDLLYVQSRGVRHGSAEVLARLAHGEDVDASEYSFRTSTQIETASPDLDWFNKASSSAWLVARPVA